VKEALLWEILFGSIYTHKMSHSQAHSYCNNDYSIPVTVSIMHVIRVLMLQCITDVLNISGVKYWDSY